MSDHVHERKAGPLKGTIIFCLWAVWASGSLQSAAAGNGYIWWEAEDFVSSSFPEETWFSPSTFPETRDGLSGGDWITADKRSAGKSMSATYRVKVSSSGTWNLWVRKFWQHGPFRWRFDGGAWVSCGRDSVLADTVTFRQHLCANWVFLGKVELEEGVHSFEILLDPEPGEDVVAGFDCFVLVPGPFVARGKLKPDQKSGKAGKGWFAWEPGIDVFSDTAGLDLRSLNEVEAGESGFVRSTNGRFATGDGSPVRFWGVNVGYGNIMQDRDSVDYLARALAKKGVNAVRIHGALWTEGDPSRIDDSKLRALHYAVHTFKRQGIYTVLSSYFPLWLPVKSGYGIGGYEAIANKYPFGLIYFDSALRSLFEGWMRSVFSATNPWTGRTLADEPALALVELVNEDSLLFWTFSKQNFPEEHWSRLENLFGTWLGKRGVWPVERLKEDDEKKGRAGLYDIWHLTGDGLRSASPAKKERAALQAEFLSGLQREFYRSSCGFLSEKIGLRSLIVPSNWTTADERLLGPLERWTYTAGDVMDSHGYFGGKHKGEGSDWSVRTGHVYEDRSGIAHPEETPFLSAAVEGFPRIVSEYAWTAPNRFRSEAPWFASVFGSLQDCGGFFFFAVGNNYLADTELAKWPVGSPAAAGMFPAAALAFRSFGVPSAVVKRENLNLADLFSLKGSAAAVWEDFFRGRVVREYSGTARAEAGEEDRKVPAGVLLDPVRGLALADTPRVQGCAGSLARSGQVVMQNLSVVSKNGFAAVLLVALDGKDLKDSRRMLLQVMTEEKMFGFNAPGGRIASMGEQPYNVLKVDMTVVLKGLGTQPVKAVLPLDENGYRSGKPVAFRGNGTAVPCRIRLLPDRMYYLVER